MLRWRWNWLVNLSVSSTPAASKSMLSAVWCKAWIYKCSPRYGSWLCLLSPSTILVCLWWAQKGVVNKSCVLTKTMRWLSAMVLKMTICPAMPRSSMRHWRTWVIPIVMARLCLATSVGEKLQPPLKNKSRHGTWVAVVKIWCGLRP